MDSPHRTPTVLRRLCATHAGQLAAHLGLARGQPEILQRAAQIVVPTLDGSIKLRIPPGTGNGQQLRVRSRGLPKGKTGERGDFYAVITIQVPQQLTEEERALWEKLQSTSTFKPRTV